MSSKTELAEIRRAMAAVLWFYESNKLPSKVSTDDGTYHFSAVEYKDNYLMFTDSSAGRAIKVYVKPGKSELEGDYGPYNGAILVEPNSRRVTNQEDKIEYDYQVSGNNITMKSRRTSRTYEHKVY